MTRDAEMRATDFAELVLGNIAGETDAFGSSRIPGYASQAVHHFSDPAHRAELRARWEGGLRELLDAAEPGGDHQLTFVRALASVARSAVTTSPRTSGVPATGSGTTCACRFLISRVLMVCKKLSLGV